VLLYLDHRLVGQQAWLNLLEPLEIHVHPCNIAASTVAVAYPQA